VRFDGDRWSLTEEGRAALPTESARGA
jgi:hypothetical protein